MTTYTMFSLAAKIRLTKNLQVKYFTSENIPIYGSCSGACGKKLSILWVHCPYRCAEMESEILSLDVTNLDVLCCGSFVLENTKLQLSGVKKL